MAATAQSRVLFTTIASIAGMVCAACSGSNPMSSAIPISQAGQRSAQIHRPSQSGVVVDPSNIGPQVTTAVLGADMDVWFDITQPGLAASFVQAGMANTRWPGGHGADHYHWQTNRYGPGKCATGFNVGKPNPKSTFDNFMTDLVSHAHLDTAITVNYGSNAQCTGGADPAEAVAWVKYANVTKHYNVTWWTVGNEQYTPDSLDLRSSPHDPTQYAQVLGADYYHQMKAASPHVPINVCADAATDNNTWDETVFKLAPFDCIELHYYPQKGTSVNDIFLLTSGVRGLTATIKLIEGELAAAGRAGTPIYLAEIGSALPPGDKQETSITQALYAGQIVGEMMNDGVARANWHSGYVTCEPPSQGGDFSRTLYGWQDYGGSMVFSDGAIDDQCHRKNVPLGTLYPTAVALQVASHFVRNREHALGASVAGMPKVCAYATTYNGGYAVMLFNLSEMHSQNVPVRIVGKTSGTGGSVWTYDKALYDYSKDGIWKGPSTSKLSSWRNSFTVTLPPWSMTVVQTH
ncbi:MAG: hypothetical protein JO350_03945 [Candidatus Eremiobacteraeota bacterium]|nr:hypothetical protein [Candidatus Eremiobacteraeota bacterium]